jgi:hypothetical protein
MQPCRRWAARTWLALVGRRPAGTPTTKPSSRPTCHETRQPEGLVAGAAGVHVRGLLGHPAADDGGELLGAGHHRPRRAACSWAPSGLQGGDARRRPARRAAAAAGLFAVGAAGGDSAGHCAGAVDARHGLAGVGRAGAGGTVAADPVERGGHHLADLRPRRHRAAGRHAAGHRHRLQLHRQRHPRLADGAGDGRVALDAAGGAAVLRRAARHPRRLLPGGAHRRRQQAGGVPLHPAAQAAGRADDRRAAALHGQLHDLHRALRADRRRARQRHHLPQPVPDAEGRGPVRRGPGRGLQR